MDLDLAIKLSFVVGGSLLTVGCWLDFLRYLGVLS